MTKLHGVLVASCAALLGGVLLASVLIVADTAYFRGPEAVRVVFFGGTAGRRGFRQIPASTFLFCRFSARNYSLSRGPKH